MNKWYVLRTPWHSLIVHFLDVEDKDLFKAMIPGYEIVAGPFESSMEAHEAQGKLLTVDQETVDLNARTSEPHMAYPGYDLSKGKSDAS